MKSILGRVMLLAILIAALASSTAQAQLGVTVPNWPVLSSGSSSGTHGIHALGDVTNPIPFIGVTPCRIVDTRGPVGPFGGPAITGGTSRDFALPSGPCAGIPASVSAYSLNFTATNTTGPGFIKVWPQGGTQPLVSTLNYLAGQTVANAAVVPAGTGGGITVKAGVSTTDVIIDINGYFSETPNSAGNFFLVSNNSPSWTIQAINSSTSCVGGCGVVADTSSGDAIFGVAQAGSGLGYGVFGKSLSTSFSAAGIHGEGNGNGQTIGVEGVCTSGSSSCTGVVGRGIGAGGYFTSSGSGTSAVQAFANGTSGIEHGVYAQESSSDSDSAGILGVDASGSPPGGGHFPAGVRGESASNVGVFGVSQHFGVIGSLLDSSGTAVAAGDLGSSLGPYGVFSKGDFGGTGAKYFVEPHPSDASKVIRYVCLEGRESGTYFRGSAQVVNGSAVIDVPEDFRIVTDVEGLTVQLTPVGAPASMYVVSEDLNQIVVQSNRDVRFHYMVNGVRKAFKDHQAISQGTEFMPRSASDRMPAYLTEEARHRLIANGTYNADGTVNMETAERVGWTRIWADRKAAAEEAAKKNAAKAPS